MTAPRPAPMGGPPPRPEFGGRRPETATAPNPDFNVEDYIDGIASFLGGNANVIMQLGMPPVAYGVMESEVRSGNIMVRPFKRLRTTLTYLAVAMMGTDEERVAYRQAVNGSHRHIRTKPTSPVKYNAFDPKLQLWVAACLYWGFVDMIEKLRGPMDEATADAFYAHSIRLGTTLQVRPEMWPPDRAAFQEYWDYNLARTTINDETRVYFNRLIDLTMVSWPLRIMSARFHRFVVTGVVPRHLRDQMLMEWTEKDQRRFDRLMRTIGAVVRRLPKPLRMFPMNYYLWDLRKRMRKGKPLV
ncbi:oxygenase MpaB family protein [Nocardia brevicatena]|uniref:oxygenase MpaB family protein n=1 Tax=Nocardia brevicatena TaxID=37327 RepID=UPI0002FD5B73|nr:oxygenase MpaB family protein [Nocardia brevicatena]